MKLPADKVCCHCGCRKPIEEFHRKPTTRDGRDSRCKGCKRESMQRYRGSSSFRDRQAAALAAYRSRGGTRRCSLCGRSKEWTDFHPSRSAPDGLSGECKVCNRVRRSIRAARPEVRAREKAYRARPEVRERARRVAAQYASSAAGIRSRKLRRRTPVGKIGHEMSNVKWQMSRTADPEKLAKLKIRLELLSSELRRILRSREAV